MTRRRDLEIMVASTVIRAGMGFHEAMDSSAELQSKLI
jgi:hypothetical protein